MSNSRVTLGALTTLVCVAVACGPGPRQGDDDDDGCLGVCSGLGYQACVGGELQPPVQCEIGQVCDPAIGCTLCIPNDLFCAGPNQIFQCNEDGTAGTQVE